MAIKQVEEVSEAKCMHCKLRFFPSTPLLYLLQLLTSSVGARANNFHTDGIGPGDEAHAVRF